MEQRKRKELTKVAIDEINVLLAEYDFPLAVLQDINHRLECCRDESYMKQQLRYLKNLVGAGKVERRGSKRNKTNDQ